MKNLKMKSLRFGLLAFAMLTFSTFAFAQDREKINVRDFSGLSVSSAFAVEISVGNEVSLEIEIEDQFRSDLIAEVRGSMLIIGLENSRKNRRMRESPKAYITVKSLNKIHVSGAVSLRTLDVIKTDDMELHLSGASVVKLELEADDLSFEASGASVVNIEGSAKTQNIRMSGSSIYRAYDFETTDTDIRVGGACSVNVYVSGDLDVRASGASSVRYKGGASVNSDTSGASSVRKG
ncbi:head GIN domain-containing protein [Roseivirga sp. E12]|uniref:head GIN domain-containing protein n=1 Tax=Roseivirga sp. E12 TaxID=2819237 RepID=UPI001ABCD24D|nr:head GIN domain-containing protein [Roseivirga sp. E12]MBO3699011.1 DUF2807 domain-containing protein [Roseivirga sp. E12]